MKTIILLLMPFMACSQISLQIKVGGQFSERTPIISPAINFAAHGLALTPELIITYKDNTAASIGIKGSYEYNIGSWSIQAGAGRYFDLYSADYYDKYKNGWHNMGFFALYYKNFFADIDTRKTFSVGYRETIGWLQ